MRVKPLIVIAAILAVLSLAACGEHANNITGPYNDATVKPAAAASSATPAPASSSNGRRRGAVSVPLLQYEGDISVVSASSVTIADSHKNDVDLTINADTVIRKGSTPLTAADLKVGDHVHAKAALKNDVKVAVEIIVQNAGDDDDHGANTATANGVVASTNASGLVVHRAEGDDVTVQVNASTSIKKKGSAITLADINTGDHVECRGTRVDAHTILAIQIEVEDSHGNAHH